MNLTDPNLRCEIRLSFIRTIIFAIPKFLTKYWPTFHVHLGNICSLQISITGISHPISPPTLDLNFIPPLKLVYLHNLSWFYTIIILVSAFTYPKQFVLQWLTYCTVQSHSWAAKWFAANQEIPRISRNPKVHYRTHKRPPPVTILGQPDPVHMPTSPEYSLYINSTNIFNCIFRISVTIFVYSSMKCRVFPTVTLLGS